MSEDESILLFRHLNEAIRLSEDDGCIALLEAVKFREARLAINSEKNPLPAQALRPERPNGSITKN